VCLCPSHGTLILPSRSRGKMKTSEGKYCNECGEPALYYVDGWDDEVYGAVMASYWCEKHNSIGSPINGEKNED